METCATTLAMNPSRKLTEVVDGLLCATTSRDRKSLADLKDNDEEDSFFDTRFRS